MKRTWLALALICLVALALLAASGVLAQGDYALTWWTVDGGGGTNSNGGYTLSSTIGQADTAAWGDGEYRLLGGFWPGGEPVGSPYTVFLPIILKP